MDIVTFQQEGRWYGLFLSSVADLVPTVYVDSLSTFSPILFGIVCYRERSLLAVKLQPLLRPARADTSPHRGRSSPERSCVSLIVVGHGAHLVGLPSETVACILDVRKERMISGISEDDTRASRLCIRYRDREIAVLDTSRLVRLVRLALGCAADGLGTISLEGRPC